MRTFLVIKLRYLGDVLLSTPVPRALKEHFPQARVVMVVNPGTEAILRYNPDVDEVLPFTRSGWRDQLRFLHQMRARRFDCVIDLTDGDRSALLTAYTGAPLTIGFNHEHRWRGRLYSKCVQASYGTMHMTDYHLHAVAPLGIQPHMTQPVLVVGEEEEKRAEQLLGEIGLLNRRWVMIHPATRYWFKAWPPERFATLSNRLVESGLQVAIVGEKREEALAEAIQKTVRSSLISFVGRTTVLELAALMKRCALFIGNDAGPMHMAAGVGTPVVGLFGPSNPAVWGPRGARTAVLFKDMDCRDCFYPGCSRGELSCMNQITVQEVFDAVQSLLT